MSSFLSLPLSLCLSLCVLLSLCLSLAPVLSLRLPDSRGGWKAEPGIVSFVSSLPVASACPSASVWRLLLLPLRLRLLLRPRYSCCCCCLSLCVPFCVLAALLSLFVLQLSVCLLVSPIVSSGSSRAAMRIWWLRRTGRSTRLSSPPSQRGDRRQKETGRHRRGQGETEGDRRQETDIIQRHRIHSRRRQEKTQNRYNSKRSDS